MKSKSKLEFMQFILVICLSLMTTVSSIMSQTTMKEAFKDHYYIGAAVNFKQIMGVDTNSLFLLEKHFNSITNENILKWERVHPSPSQYNFTPADSFVALGEKHNMFIVGHTLIWHAQTPKWVFEDDSGNLVDRETLLQRMHDHIFTVVGRYKDHMHGWDVVNEAIEDDGQLRESKWKQIIGEDYIQKAFEWAHEADPNAELYYNDYSMWKPERRNRVVQLIGNLLDKGVPIHGIGLQGHWDLGLDNPPLADLEASILAYSNLGLKVMITELDINVLPRAKGYYGADISLNYELQDKLNPYTEGLPDSMQKKLTDRYVELFTVLNKHKDKISRVTFWGIYDGQSWLNHWPVRGRTSYPLLFDRQYLPKPAFYAIIKNASETQ
jgi:endo-1,4-beta-xylanase